MNYAVILAGGKGVRFWPLSRHDQPKQLLKIFSRRSLLQHTYLRTSKIVKPENIYIITNNDYISDIKYQLKEIGLPINNVIAEISPKNTAASIGLVASIISKKDKDAVLAVFPSDHFIKKEKIFLNSVKKALKLSQNGLMILFGIKPDAPEIGYGYVKTDKAYNSGALKVLDFIEKPDKIIAKKLIKSKTMYWNGGIFIWQVGAFLEQVKKFLPDLNIVLNEKDGDVFTKKWNALKPISVDYGILEKCKNSLYLMPLACGWTDLGSWSTIDAVLKRDKNGNAFYGDVLAIGTTNTTIWAGHHLVAGIGLNNMIIADTPDALLVAPKEQAQKVSQIVEMLKTGNRFEHTISCTSERPWGKYLILNENKNFKVKKVEVGPHKRLSLQLHKMRAEHWIVVEGIAKVTIEGKTHFINSNESIYVPLGAKHRIENESDKKLVLIEVQTGSYLGEDDIVRFEDDYRNT